jgi:hypothetical protein
MTKSKDITNWIRYSSVTCQEELDLEQKLQKKLQISSK